MELKSERDIVANGKKKNALLNVIYVIKKCTKHMVLTYTTYKYRVESAMAVHLLDQPPRHFA